jgi:hypothetical protein
MNRKSLIAAVLIAAGAAAMTAPAVAQVNVDLVIGNAPPPLRYEPIPTARHGYIWAPGYWSWNGRRHVWVGGSWVAERPGYVYMQPQWVEQGGRWYYQSSRWDRRDRDHDGIPNRYDRDRDGDGIPNRYDRNPDGRNYSYGRGNDRGHDRGRGHDNDRDGIPNRYDRDRDGDGVPNRYDDRPDNPRRR